MTARRHGRLRLLLLAALLAPPAGGAVLAPPAWDAAACPGVAVVVDFRTLGGGAQTGCAPGDPSSGLTTLTGAGFTYSFVPHQLGLVCQINGKPDPCNGAQPTAYWSYWHATPGGSWIYSNLGAGSYNPVPGAVEGWSFGAGQPPSIAPPAAVAPPPATTQPPVQQPAPAPPISSGSPTTTSRATQPRPAQPGAPQPDAPHPGAEQPNGAQQGAATSVPQGQTESLPPDGETTADSASSTPDRAGPTTVSNVSATPHSTAPPSSGFGGALDLLAGVMIVGGLGGLAFLTARRRAKPAPHDLPPRTDRL
jgi:hypothetical protein